MLAKCYIYFDEVRASIVLDTANFKQTIIHGNTNRKMILKQVNLIDDVHHLYYQ